MASDSINGERAWWALALLPVIFAAVLAAAAPRFDYDFEVIDMPVVWLALGLSLAGLLYLPLRLLIERAGPVQLTRRGPLVAMLGAGLVARLVLLPSVAILEDDFQRYLLEGGLVVHGISPYAMSAKELAAAPPQSADGQLAASAGPTLGRVNHPDLRSIYPPVAQAFFAVAHLLKPWSLVAWRTVCLIAELATVALLLMLLREAGRSPLWAALYWWNPVVLKELCNSAHMEAVLLPFVLGALLLAARRRFLAGTVVLGFAAGVKFWPAILLPLVLAQLRSEPRRLLALLVLFALMIAAWLLPIWLGGSDHSGLLAYLRYWKTNSALFPVLEAQAGRLLALLGAAPEWAGRTARVLVAVILGGLALGLARAPCEGPAELLRRSALLVFAVVLLSPAQFPWYTTWAIPFLAFRPVWGMLLLAATIPIYYLGFHFLARSSYAHFKEWVVWMIWVPVWLALAAEAWLVWRRSGPAAAGGRASA